MIHALLLSTLLLAQAPDASLPASADNAKAALESSPRHGEYIDVKMPGGGAPIRTWISYPERKDKAGVVIVIQEIFGLTDWLRGVADQLAKEGFIAVAPDMVSGLGPGGGGTESVSSRDDVVALTRGISPEEANKRLDAVRDWAIKLPAANGKSATVGFCWGGAPQLRLRRRPARPQRRGRLLRQPLPTRRSSATIKAPVQGHYGGDDARVNATIAPAEAEMKKLGKTYEPHIYEGAGHGFLRDQEARDGANMKATREAWPLTVKFLKERLK